VCVCPRALFSLLIPFHPLLVASLLIATPDRARVLKLNGLADLHSFLCREMRVLSSHQLMDLFQCQTRKFLGRQVGLRNRVIVFIKDPFSRDRSTRRHHGIDFGLNNFTEIIQWQIIVIVIERVFNLITNAQDAQEGESSEHGGRDHEGIHVGGQLEGEGEEVDPGSVMQMDRVGEGDGGTENAFETGEAVHHSDEGIVHHGQGGGIDFTLVAAALDVAANVVGQLDGDVGRGQEVKGKIVHVSGRTTRTKIVQSLLLWWLILLLLLLWWLLVVVGWLLLWLWLKGGQIGRNVNSPIHGLCGSGDRVFGDMGQELNHVCIVVSVFFTQVVLGGKSKGDQKVDGGFLFQQIACLGLGDADPDTAGEVTDTESHLGPKTTSFPVAIVG